MDRQTAIIHLEMPTGGASDKRLKQHISPIRSSLKNILALKPVTWYWKDDKKEEKLQYGFIAQEVEKIFPAMVHDEKWHDGEDRKFLSVGEMTPHIVEAMKEQNKNIIEVSKQVAELATLVHSHQKEIDTLRSEINKGH